jgi:hypothetical protein
MDQLDDLVKVSSDYDGSTFTVYKDGYEAFQQRMTMLEELMSLRKPVNLYVWCEGGYQCSWGVKEYAEYEKYLQTEPQ